MLFYRFVVFVYMNEILLSLKTRLEQAYNNNRRHTTTEVKTLELFSPKKTYYTCTHIILVTCYSLDNVRSTR